MEVELAQRPPEVKNKQTENNNQRYSAEHHRAQLEQTRREKGDRFLAYELGAEYYEAKFQIGTRPSERFLAYKQAQVEAIESMLPEIKSNSELNEIFSTSYQLAEAIKNAWGGKDLTVSSFLNKPKKTLQELDKLREAKYAYREKILGSSKPAISTEQLPPFPRLCVPATLYQSRNETIPESHTQNCQICSAHAKEVAENTGERKLDK